MALKFALRSAASIGSALLVIAALPCTARASTVVMSTQGPGGSIPDGISKTGGFNYIPTWPALVSPVTVPKRIDRITSVEIFGLQHLWRGDLHIYLENPAGVRFNVVVRPGDPNPALANMCQLGDYKFVPSGAANFGVGSNISGGTYNQYLNSGTWQWNVPAYPIANAPMLAIAGDAGTWKLHIRDWWIDAQGSITGWRLHGENDGDVGALCFGDGAGLSTPCPCAPGATGHGCANSSGGSALLVANGGSSLAVDELELVCTGMMPFSASIFFQASGIENFGFGALSPTLDGLHCLSFPMVRIGGRGTLGDRATLAHLASNPTSPATVGTRYYQVVYRDAASYCTSGAWNTSNAIKIYWEP
jgi:hypothetical protein